MPRRRTRVGFEGNEKDFAVEVPDSVPEIWGADAKLRVVGTAVPRVDGLVKASGAARFTADVRLPGMLHGAMLRAPSPGGTLKALDLSAAMKAPGVALAKAVANPGQRLLMDGQDLAFLVADTEDHLEDALALCRVEIEPGPVVATVEDATAPGAPSVFPDKPSNVRSGQGGRGGDETAFATAEKAMEGADAVVEAVYRTQVQVHTALEPHGVVVVPDGDGGVTVYASTQGTFAVRDHVAQALKVPGNKVRVIAEHVGGGFGAKLHSSAPGSAFVGEAARAAVELGKPIRAMLDRRSEMAVGGNRPSSEQRAKIGLQKDGKVLGYTVRSRGTSGISESGARSSNPMIYGLGATAKEDLTVLTMAGPGFAFRAPGHPQGSFALESILDEAAEAIGMDPLELRRRLDRSEVRLAQYEEGAHRIGWKEKRAVKPGAGRGPVKRGVGMGSATWGLGRSSATVQVTVHRDGGVEVLNGAQDIGTGTRTVMAVIVAEVLGLDPGDLTVRLGNTDWPPGPGSGGSQTAAAVGPAARAAAEEARKGILGDRKPAGKAAWKKACAAMDGETKAFLGSSDKPFQSWVTAVAGCQFAEVEVDIETGVVRVVRVVAVQDCGRVVDRLTAESQILGGVIQGISYALFEDRVLDRKTGRFLNGDLERYRIAGSRDVPDIEVVAFSVANAGNSVGMAGIGEPPTIPTAGAIANAVYHATGARVRELPITPARVLAALAAKGGK